MNGSIAGILEELEIQVNQSTQHLKCNHQRYLRNLSPIEKDYLAERCVQWAWNVGSLRMMSFLQVANVLSMTEYILDKHTNDAKEVQLIFSDLLETEYSLLADLISQLTSNDSTALTIADIVTEGLRRLIVDLSENPNILQTNYLPELEEFLLDTQSTAFKALHFKLLLEATEQCVITEAIEKQKDWNADFSTVQDTTLGSIVADVIGGCDKSVKLARIIEASALNDFKSWKFSLLLLKFVVQCSETDDLAEFNALKATAKAFVKNALKKFVETKDVNIFFHMMLIARQICYSSEGIHGSYAIWFKATFGELKYYLKADEFTFTIQTMMNMIEYENDKDILQIHINTTIPAPTFCNNIVMTYKQMLRSKQFYCTAKLINAKNTDELATMDENEKPTEGEPEEIVYVLDDDDD